MKRYEPAKVESKWQKVWEETGIYKTPAQPKDKFYCLVMFPYPSGDLHAGHWYNFAPADAVARYHRMLGREVLHPIGFDAFGLPAENAAIKRQVAPAEWTRGNIESMTKQLQAIGAMYDWDKTVDTSSPDYYRWTQWLFLQLYKHGLAYKAKGIVNWCPKDQTVLANEQVIQKEGKNVCERCETEVTQKELEQWYFKITDYGDRLLDDLEELDWPARVKTMQRNWIGKSVGAEVHFDIDGSKDKIEVFTTRPDTLFGATYMVLAPEHPLVDKITTKEHKQEVTSYVKQSAGKTELDRMEGKKEKAGVFTGAYAINPVNDEKIPVLVADYVLMGYGTGAIMAVPAHDERDYAFAKKYDLPIKPVIAPEQVVRSTIMPSETKHIRKFEALGVQVVGENTVGAKVVQFDPKKLDNFIDLYLKVCKPGTWNDYTGVQTGFFYKFKDGTKDRDALTPTTETKIVRKLKQFVPNWPTQDLWTWFSGVDWFHEWMIHSGEGIVINSAKYDGLGSSEMREKIVADLAKKKAGKEQVNYRLRDWSIGRQRYWGAPIPIIYCKKCGEVPVPEEDLPVLLPEDVEFEPTGKPPLMKRDDFVNVECPQCDGEARREVETMDAFVDSSWYFLRYPNNKYDKGAFDPKAVEDWMPVDHYLGGIEHAILHLLYARFITKVLADHAGLGFGEPFLKLFNQGIILGPDGAKMSKSKGNVVNPDEWVDKYGADTFRLYLMFIGPWDEGGPFDTKGIAGTRRFLERVWALIDVFINQQGKSRQSKVSKVDNQGELETQLAVAANKTIQKVTEDIRQFGFNTAIASLMELTNTMYKLKVELPFSVSPEIWRTHLEQLLLMLAPLAPHISEELWQAIGQEESIHLQGWPAWDDEFITDELATIVVQVNGKVRANIPVAAGASEAEVVEQARQDANVAKHLKGKQVVKTVFVPDKLINFVVK